MSNAEKNTLRKFNFLGFNTGRNAKNGGTSNGGEVQLDEECAKVFVMESDSMGFDFKQPPFSGQPAKFGEKDYMQHRKTYPHMYQPIKIGNKSMKRRNSSQNTSQQAPQPPLQSQNSLPLAEVPLDDNSFPPDFSEFTQDIPEDILEQNNPNSSEPSTAINSPNLDKSILSITTPKSTSPLPGDSDTGQQTSLLQEDSDAGGNSSESECVLSDPCNYVTHEKDDVTSPRKVSFLQNESTDKFDVDGIKEKKKRRHHHIHHAKFRKYSLPEERYRRVSTQPEDQELLPNDRDQLDSHRSDDPRAFRRHKTSRPSNVSLMHIGKGAELHPSLKKLYDHSPHAIFVELDELQRLDDNRDEKEWKETARWIKYEEDVEEGVDRWGKPHVASLSFHSLLNLRRCLEEGLVILDMEERDLPGIAYRVSEELYKEELIKEEDKIKIMKALLLRHRHVNEHDRGFKFSNKKQSHASLQSLWLEDGVNYDALMMARCSVCSAQGQLCAPHAQALPRGTSYPHTLYEPEKRKVSFPADAKNGDPSLEGLLKPTNENHTIVDMKDDHTTSQEDVRRAQNETILKRIPLGAQGSTVLVGEVDFLEQPAISFIRLAEGIVVPSLIEVNIPVRFIFMLLGPKLPNIDYHEVGRSIATLMANQQFHSIAYRADTRKELLSAINEFLDDSIVLPPGDWERQALLPIEEIKAKSERIRRRKENALQKAREAQGIVVSAKALLVAGDDEKKPPSDDPLQRTGRAWGGLINDLKRRYPFYVSDFIDGLNIQCFAAAVFMYFAAVAGAIAFGGLTGDKTGNLIGISETLLCTSIGGVIFALLAGQPLIIIGTTGALLLFDESLYQFCQSMQIDFLSTRVYIGLWLAVIGVVVACFEGSLFVKFFSRFVEEIFSSLIVLLYILESLQKVWFFYEAHPLLPNYCEFESVMFTNDSYMHLLNDTSVANDSNLLASINFNALRTVTELTQLPKVNQNGLPINQPNTALFCTILTLGTFGIAYYLRIFRNSKFLGRNARRALGDFGVPIAMFCMVLVDYFVPETYTEKLNVPEGFSPSEPEKRGWLIPIDGVPIWIMFAAAVPAILVYILVFMETHISELIIGKPERRLKKGCGIHLDIVIISLINIICGIFGFPWLCGAAVRSIVHTSALTVMSRTHAPGEKPHLIEVKEQRLSALVVSLCIGLSVFMSSILKIIPMAVVIGIFLYMGVASIDGIQFFDRLRLLFVPVKHHPQSSYIRKVRTAKMHLFTFIQLICLVVLWIVKSTKASLAFPFFLILMVPLRAQMNRFFTQRELRALDGDQADMDDEEPDFYAEVPLPG